MRPVGLLPAAGRGDRFRPCGYPKEIFPVRHVGATAAEPLCASALRQLDVAGAEACVVAVSEEKDAVRDTLGERTDTGLTLRYVRQPEPRGLPDVVRQATRALGDHTVILVLPDTVVTPTDAARRIHDRLVHDDADLVLGVFPTDEPERLGPVLHDADGRVRQILDKPAHSPVGNTWGLAAWSSRFTRFCHDWDVQREKVGAEQVSGEQASGEAVLGEVFEAARLSGMRVLAVPFDNGGFADLGTPEALRAAIDQGLVAPER
ncbi:MAG: sugar phosphate nucleotidyltransferase [Acidobacteriota bacterium]